MSLTETGKNGGGERLGRNKLARHPGGVARLAFWTFGGEVQSGDRNLGVIIVWMVFKTKGMSEVTSGVI